MPNETTGFKSIAEALAAAEKKRGATAATAPKKGPWFKTGGGTGVAPRSGPAAPPSAKLADLRDEFDFAIEAVETARKAMPRDAAGAEAMATSILAAKQKLPRAEAADLIKRAIRYLER